MKKENYINDLKEIQGFLSKVHTVNEAMSFADEYDDYDAQMGADEEAPEGCVDGECDLAKLKGEEPTEEDGLRELNEVDQIREIAISGMLKLCKNPEDERYQALKKIFQFCDKAVENKDKEEAR